MSMSPIVVSTWPGEKSPTTPLTFLLTKAALDAILTNSVLLTAIPGSGGLATQTNWVGLLTSPAQNPDPSLIVAILDAALLGGGLTGPGDFSYPVPDALSTCVAQRIHFGNPTLARSTCAQIVAACIAAG